MRLQHTIALTPISGTTSSSLALRYDHCPTTEQLGPIVTHRQVTRILLDQQLGGAVATGVEFIAGGRRFTAKVRKEIILAAGAVQTPQLLELSGRKCSSEIRRITLTSSRDWQSRNPAAPRYQDPCEPARCRGKPAGASLRG